ncbi:protein kinase family protein [Modestobacter sp. Leaf380]|uniref:protein kinase family protein n=1 Tax=Modestobacter sp. Leaf380 TaxID=1736356 RepID=UPI0006FBFC92|nr:protein kinase family protein [Modestobacter sp. Leaf380]KQS66840.1 hypothetical protein ASG41_10545 [Modestobacter sp. Leaf380]
MTSTTTGLPDRYRPLDQLAPDEPTSTGVIRSWRARDRVLNRDVALRVHHPGGPAARAWITRALTAGGLATPALAMVYDAAEGTPDDSPAAYVVNEWIEGQTLAHRLEAGPLPEREARTVVRRLAEGVAEAHRVGLAVGGLTPEHVVLRSGGLVGLLAVPAAEGTVPGDIAALGALLELCLTGRRGDTPGAVPPVITQPDLAALVRRARSTEPGTALSSVAAMVALLGERVRTDQTGPLPTVRGDETESGWLRKLRDRRDAADAEGLTTGAPPAGARPAVTPPVPAPAHRGLVDDDDDRDDRDDRAAEDDRLDWGSAFHDGSDDDPVEDDLDTDGAGSSWRRRLVVVGLPLLALAMVIGVGWWFGTNVISAASSVEDPVGSTPTFSAPAESPAPSEEPPAAAPLQITAAEVFDPFGDGEPENDDDVPLSYDGDPATSWPTLNYRGSAEFGNLKPGVGVLYDLGSEQALSGVTIATDTPGAVVEVRTGDSADGDLESYPVAAGGELSGTDELTFDEAVTTRYVLVWVTGLVSGDEGFSADIAEVTPVAAG